MFIDDSPEGFMLAKAVRVCESGMRRRAAPRTRSALLDMVAIIKRRIKTGDDPVLKSLGMSLAGIRHFLETEYALEVGEADLLASAFLHLITR